MSTVLHQEIQVVMSHRLKAGINLNRESFSFLIAPAASGPLSRAATLLVAALAWRLAPRLPCLHTCLWIASTAFFGPRPTLETLRQRAAESKKTGSMCIPASLDVMALTTPKPGKQDSLHGLLPLALRLQRVVPYRA